jgi:transposase
VGLRLASASPAEITLLEATLDQTEVPPRGRRRLPRRPKRLIADRAYDSDKHRIRLAKRRIDLICPHRKNRIRPALQDGRKLRRYKRRWIIERTIAWFGNFRRLVVRWDRDINIYRAFFHVACILITVRQF